MTERLVRTLPLIFFAFFFVHSAAAQDGEASRETSPAEVEQCVAQHDSARQLRLNEAWLNARVAMQSCADERCPLAIAADCRAWLEELSRALPTLLVVIEREERRDPANPLRASLDGKPFEVPEPPTPVELMPGRHRLRVALGPNVIERDFVLQQFEKNHVEHLRFAAKPRPAAPERAVANEHRPVPVTTYALSGGALVAFAGAGLLLESALRERQEAELTCAPYCATSVRDKIRNRLVLADIAAGVGLVLAGAGLYTFVRRPVVTGQAQGSGPTLVATPSGASLFWQGHF